ncbi:MAG: putative DNA-binding protein [Ruminococcus sp.]|nr:putative DNA-binding protein [Ruminococcus sp.]
MEIDKNLHMGILLDIYGELLTERQYEMMSMYFHDDLSLSEIAEQYDISRQGVHDAIKRGEESLVNYDSVLKLAEMQEKQKEQLLEFKAQALEALDECRKVSFGKNIADKVIALLENLDSKLEEFENTVEN